MNKLSTWKRRKKHIKERKKKERKKERRKEIHYKMNKLSICKRRKNI